MVLVGDHAADRLRVAEVAVGAQHAAGDAADAHAAPHLRDGALVMLAVDLEFSHDTLLSSECCTFEVGWPTVAAGYFPECRDCGIVAADNNNQPFGIRGGSEVVDRRNDPAFLYFPDNYRWSMGLMICLSGAPWGGAEIDDVNRVGRALADKVGDDDAWFEEWTRMGDKIEAQGRAAEREGHKLTGSFVLSAGDTLLPDR